jgi:hypothetical protein
VPPGTDLVWTAEGGGWLPPALSRPGLRRRAVGDRAGGSAASAQGDGGAQ